MCMSKLIYNYHTHTSRCGHAIGEDEEYIKKAIDLGIKRLGISDHIFFPGFNEPGVRGNYEQLDEYLNTFRNFREKYKDKVEMKIGFEAEYFPSYREYYFDLIKKGDIEYLILGQHYGEFDGKFRPYYENIMRYAEDVKEAVSLGIFKYVAHPDHFLLGVKSWDEECEKVARIIFEACEKSNTPIEINILGIRQHRPYPCKEFFKLSKEYKLKYVLGVDAHNPNDFNQPDIDKAFEYLNELGIDIIDLHI